MIEYLKNEIEWFKMDDVVPEIEGEYLIYHSDYGVIFGVFCLEDKGCPQTPWSKAGFYSASFKEDVRPEDAFGPACGQPTHWAKKPDGPIFLDKNQLELFKDGDI